MTDQPFRSTDQLVIVHVCGAGTPTPGPGGWAAVLTYGEHTREIHGAERDTTADRMSLISIVRALECLKRPSRVDVWIAGDSEYLRHGIDRWLPASRQGTWTASADKPDRDVDLWLRLVGAVERHGVEWVWVADGIDNHDHARATELALEERGDVQAQVVDEHAARPAGQPSIENLLADFLAEQSERLSAKTYTRYKDVIRLLRGYLGNYCSVDVNEGEPAQIVSNVGGFVRIYVPDKVASEGIRQAAGTVTAKLVRWLGDRGHVEKESTRETVSRARKSSSAMRVMNRFENLVDKSIDKLHAARLVFDADKLAQIEGMFLVDGAEDGELWLAEKHDYGSPPSDNKIGPIAIPAAACELWESYDGDDEWELYAHLARVDGTWQLISIGGIGPAW